MVWFKACKRCGGDLYLERDFYGSYVACLQCGSVLADFDEKAPTSSIVEELQSLVVQRQTA